MNDTGRQSTDETEGIADGDGEFTGSDLR